MGALRQLVAKRFGPLAVTSDDDFEAPPGSAQASPAGKGHSLPRDVRAAVWEALRGVAGQGCNLASLEAKAALQEAFNIFPTGAATLEGLARVCKQQA